MAIGGIGIGGSWGGTISSKLGYSVSTNAGDRQLWCRSTTRQLSIDPDKTNNRTSR
ncbi:MULTISPECIES: hypothetical protein [unclassified Chamaesiphon]|uniref:hypothetical protein n=1 Tax=unclassified Chamaesiphon TaxID=2620921 RepID=UPI00286A3DB7|nr:MULTISPECIES: hypothetical protein [unclassified Chamaesiphon]